MAEVTGFVLARRGVVSGRPVSRAVCAGCCLELGLDVLGRRSGRDPWAQRPGLALMLGAWGRRGGHEAWHRVNRVTKVVLCCSV